MNPEYLGVAKWVPEYPHPEVTQITLKQLLTHSAGVGDWEGRDVRSEISGAEAAINYRDQDFVEEVHRLTHRKGVDVVVDMVGGDYLPRNLSCLAEEGRQHLLRARVIAEGDERARVVETAVLETREIPGVRGEALRVDRLRPRLRRPAAGR